MLAPGAQMLTDVGEPLPNGSARGRGWGWGRSRVWDRDSLDAREDVVSIKCSQVVTTIVDIGLGMDVTGGKSC